MEAISGRVLITGGLGYVGGRIATYLAAASPQLHLRLMTRRGGDGVPAWATGMDIVQADLLDEDSLAAAVDDIDTVIHLAAVNVTESEQDPDLALEVNGRGTHRLLQICHAQAVKRFIYFSTFHVYGPLASHPINEATATRPIHPYAITHRLAEDMVNWYRHSYGIDTLILRLSNGYGYPADSLVNRWDVVFNDLCKQAIQQGEIRLRSRGEQHRDFVSLTDVARAVQHLLMLPTEKWQDGLFNLGGARSMSILEVAELVASELFNYCGKKVPISVLESDETPSTGPVVYSIDKLKRTGFSLAGDSREEIRGTFRMCEESVP